MTVNINSDLLRKVVKGLEGDKITRADRSFLIRLLRELLEATEKTPQIEGEPQSFIKVIIQNPANQRLQQILDEQVAEQERQRRSELTEITSASLSASLRTVLDASFEQVDGLYDAYIFLYESGRLAYGAGRAATSRDDLPWRSPRPRGLTYTVARLGQTMVIPDMSTHPLFADLNWTGSIIGLPLKIGPRVVGVLTISRRPMHEFTETELHILQSIADQCAVVIENARIGNLAKEQVRIDAATGLHNRRALEELLEKEVINAADGQVPFALFMLDLDGYEEINRRYGHSAGDFLLAETATAISKDLRKTDFLARYGASRYSLVLSQTDRSTALSISERIQDITSRRRFNLPEKGARKVSVSIGIAVFPEDGPTSHKMIESASNALLQASNEPGSVQFASQPAESSPPPLAP
ncbi:MAG: sensor domain-containing diguanylate cyclase [Anaerolineaceae bacterium]|nr:sensor domain-containing diguanylate cyclase [Anaerolineaceae bacterium]